MSTSSIRLLHLPRSTCRCQHHRLHLRRSFLWVEWQLIAYARSAPSPEHVQMLVATRNFCRWLSQCSSSVDMGGAAGGVGGRPTFGTRGYRGRSNENDLCFNSRQSLFSTVQVTEFQLSWLQSTPAKLMISEKTAWVVFPRSTPTGLLHYSNLHANMIT